MELEFRDGPREVHDHLAVQMHGMETFKMTYEEAVRAVDEKRQRDFLNGIQDRVVTDHFKNMRGEL